VGREKAKRFVGIMLIGSDLVPLFPLRYHAGEEETNMIVLSEEQQQALATMDEAPPTVFDPRTNEKYVLLRSALYDRVRGLVQDDSDLTKREVAILVDRAMSEYDAGDSTLALYQHD
jgi:hypothetical protein